MRMVTICLSNQKGGCAKSSTCFHLAGAFAKQGLNLLLVDADPQASITKGIFGPDAVRSLAKHETVAALFDQTIRPSSLESVIVPTPYERISIVRSSRLLRPHNVSTPEDAGMDQHALSAFIQSLTDFHLVLIDCPPNLHLCTWAAMLASNFVIVPLQAEDYAAQGIEDMTQAINDARHLNEDLELLGYLITMYDRRLVIHESYQTMLRDVYGPLVFDTLVPISSTFKVSLASRQPVSIHSPRTAAAKATDAVAEEVLKRIHRSMKRRRAA